MKRIIFNRVVLVLMAMSVLIGCSGGERASLENSSDEEIGEVSISIEIYSSALDLSKPSEKGLEAPAPASVNSFRVYMTGPGINPQITRLLVRGTDFDATTDPINVILNGPKGRGRAITWQAYASNDGSGTPIFQGATKGVKIGGKNSRNNIAVVLFPPPSGVPTISSYEPESGCPFSSVVIRGTNFDPIPDENRVIFLKNLTDSRDDALPRNDAATPNEVKISVPEDVPSVGKIQVSNRFGSAIGSKDFTVLDCTPKPPPAAPSPSAFRVDVPIGIVNTIVPVADGTGDIYVGGHNFYAGKSDVIFRLNSDGTVDAGFTSGRFDYPVHTIAHTYLGSGLAIIHSSYGKVPACPVHFALSSQICKCVIARPDPISW